MALSSAAALSSNAKGATTKEVIPGFENIRVKQEHPDEAEIRELAAKLVEANKVKMARTTRTPNQSPGSTQLVQPGQPGILNYFSRGNGQQNKSAGGDKKPGLTMDSDKNPPCDKESVRGRFGWVTLGKCHVPFILRYSDKYCALRMVQSKLLSKYQNHLHSDIFSCTCIRSYYITDAEARLLNEVNVKHCEGQFGREPFTTEDLLVRLQDAGEFYNFLEVCYNKLLLSSNNPKDKCGFIRINGESVVPYTVRNGYKYVPLFYIEGETHNLKLKAEKMEGWDLAYLKFCCKVQGIRNELFVSETCSVISFPDIKSYFPPGTEFEEYWPSKVVDSQLLLASNKSPGLMELVQPGQPGILNYFPQGNGQQNKSAGGDKKPGLTVDSDKKQPCDEESVRGRFGWVTLGKCHVPFILRYRDKYCALRMVESKLLSKYRNHLHSDFYSCTCIRSYYITDAEARLLNEVNVKHCEGQFGREPFTTEDLLVRLQDAGEFYNFLEVCYNKLLLSSNNPKDKCGFIRINGESVVPYTVRNGYKYVPLFYIEGETHNLKLKAEKMEGWDLAYLKFCCKVQGIRNELFVSETCSVISFPDIKSYFPPGTEFEEYWPSKVVDSQLLLASNKSPGLMELVQPGQPGILNYFPQGNGQQNKSAGGDKKPGLTVDSDKKQPCDEESVRGRFGWVTLGKCHVPFILRYRDKYCALRMVESKLLSKYRNHLHSDFYSCTCIRSYYITDAEARLLNEVNVKHCEGQFGREPFTTKDLVVRLQDAGEFYNFLEVCYNKLLLSSNNPKDKCGFIRINGESVVAYTVRNGHKYVPLFYIEGETHNLKLKAEKLEGWELAYLKFCCKVQGIRNELFASETCSVISLTDIKSYFPPGTEFEEYWPSKVVDSKLHLASNKGSVTSARMSKKQPGVPPAQQHSTTNAVSLHQTATTNKVVTSTPATAQPWTAPIPPTAPVAPPVNMNPVGVQPVCNGRPTDIAAWHCSAVCSSHPNDSGGSNFNA